MNAYDLAKQLAETIKLSDEYVQYKNAKKNVYSNEKCKTVLQNIEDRMMEIQLASMQGGEIEPDKIEEYEKLQAEAMQNETIKDYYEKEMKFEQIMNEISQVISETVEL
ncbi:YlbF family regulator [Sedimentibacter sp. zth1]|uniref:YlbF family regulator n=1 Tax=Sedimentibacter sp. zth1 TaxID=2816908 RepID=UPI001A92FFEF|nr:YlbF family regulator [Sedimentibacter sp. zth1]QSX06439.1 YlbF family regulator [Sedimentibacter sp. zth1]